MDNLIDQAIQGARLSLNQLAGRLGESPQTVSNWRKRGVPVNKCAQLEQLSNRAVLRWQMRPADWHLIWPELIGTQDAPQSAVQAAAASAEPAEASHAAG